MIDVDVIVEAEGWEGINPAAMSQSCVRAILDEAPTGLRPGVVALLFTSDGVVSTLNQDFRGKDGPTNVLSFPSQKDDLRPEGVPDILGDVAIAHGVCAREAAERDIILRDHAAHLVVHGILHLLGYDHRDDDEAQAMEDLEGRILARMGLSDPYS